MEHETGKTVECFDLREDGDRQSERVFPIVQQFDRKVLQVRDSFEEDAEQGDELLLHVFVFTPSIANSRLYTYIDNGCTSGPRSEERAEDGPAQLHECGVSYRDCSADSLLGWPGPRSMN